MSTEQGESLPLSETMCAWTDGRHARGEIVFNTWRASRYHISKFADHFGDYRDLRSITADDVELWIESLRVQPQSRNTICSTLRKFFAWATRRRILTENPFLDVTNAKVAKRAPRRVPVAQAASVINSADFRGRVMITLTLQIGLRRSELTALRVEDWDRVNDKLLIRGKGSKERTSAVEGEAKEALTAWLADGRTTGPMWPSIRRKGHGLSSNRVGTIIADQAQNQGLHITTHQYRHTMASEMVMDGAPLEVVRRQLGHESIATTGVYLASDVEESRPYVRGRHYYKGQWGGSAPPEEELAS